MTTPDRLQQQVTFLLTCDRLKHVRRSTYLHDASRAENSAEHSWHLALMAQTLGEYAPPGTDMEHVTRLLLTHDLVEIHAGDLHFAAPDEQQAAQAQAEADAARQLFSLLPPDQAQVFHALHAEFEARATPEARFARALDALHPILLTWAGRGAGCATREPDLTATRLLPLKGRHLAPYPALWALAQEVVQDAINADTLPR
ncbi:HD domain-containing protein [Deinococcus sp. PEB2-63]